MMLSDAEQRKLTEIESRLRADDPDFVRGFDDGPRRREGRNGWPATLALVVAVTAVGTGLVLGSVGIVVVALIALGAAAGMWITRGGRLDRS